MNSERTVRAAYYVAGRDYPEAHIEGHKALESGGTRLAPGRWNDEDKARTLALQRTRFAGGITAASAGGTNTLGRYFVRFNFDLKMYEVVDVRFPDKARLRLKQFRWAQLTAAAYDAGLSPAAYGRAHGIDTSGYTLR